MQVRPRDPKPGRPVFVHPSILPSSGSVVCVLRLGAHHLSTACLLSTYLTPELPTYLPYCPSYLPYLGLLLYLLPS